MHTDPIADMITRIRNAYRAWKKTMEWIPYSNLKRDVLNVLKDNWYLSKVEEWTNDKWFKVLSLVFWKKNILNLKRISKPWQRIYVKSSEIKPVMNWYWISVISTSKWVMPWYKAYKEWIWWELMFEIY